MEANKKSKEIPVLLEWLADERGDNLAIKFGRRVYTVDKYGNLNSQRYKRVNASEITDGTRAVVIEGLADMRLGTTYTISSTDIVVGKLIESNLFGYRFFCVKPDNTISFVDIDYEDAIRYCQDGNIKIIQQVYI